MPKQRRQIVSRFTMALEGPEMALLQALKAHIEKETGLRVSLAEVARTAMRHFATAHNISVDAQ